VKTGRRRIRQVNDPPPPPPPTMQLDKLRKYVGNAARIERPYDELLQKLDTIIMSQRDTARRISALETRLEDLIEWINGNRSRP